MPVYSYKAITSAGTLVEGKQAAVSVDELRSELAAQDLLLQDVRAMGSWWGRLFQRRSVSREQFMLFTHELSTLLNSGITLPETLRILSDRPGQPQLQQSLQKILASINEGQSLSQACAKYPDIFDRLFVAAINIGENSGDLVKSIRAYQSQLSIQIRFMQKIRQAMAYPVFLTLTLVLMLSLLFLFVLPRFVSIYANFGSELPLPTQWLILLVESSYIVIPVMLLMSWLGRRIFISLVKQDATGLWIDRKKLSLPYLGALLRLSYTGQIAGLLATLLTTGVPLVRAIQITIDSINNRYINHQLSEVKSQVESGTGLSKALESSRLFPDTSLNIMQAGEASGNLSGMLQEVASYHEYRVDNALARIMAFIEPLIMLVMGLVIGGIIFVMYLPIFNVAEVIK